MDSTQSDADADRQRWAEKLTLPATLQEAETFYTWYVAQAGTAAKKREARAWLGRNDLFYLLTQLLNRGDLRHPWLFDRCRQVQAEPDGYLDLWAREHGKALSTETTILTANRGWTTHGDLVPGDHVFAPSGQAVQVLATRHFADGECFRVTFEDGNTIVAHANHLWRIRRKQRRRQNGTAKRLVTFVEELHTTKALLTLGGRQDVGACEPLHYPTAVLPLDPYVLGLWLGNGTCGAADLTMHVQDQDWVETILAQCGVVFNTRPVPNANAIVVRMGTGQRYQPGSSDVRNTLRELGVFNAKHIPDVYLHADIDQRMALLQGLMDTDGYCNQRGNAAITQSNQRLAEQIYDLAASLGLRPRIREKLARCSGKTYPAWLVEFQAHQDRNPFRLPRKAKNAIPSSCYRGVRTIKTIEPVATVPTNCITVEGGLYCAGRALIPTHNSSVITFGMTIFDILRDPNITVGIFSHTRKIARTFLQQIMREFEANDDLKVLFPDILYQKPSKEAAKWSEDDGIIVKRTSNPKEATVEAWGLVDSQPTGRHFILMVYDDTVTRESVTTPEQVAKVTDAWSLSQNLGTQEEKGGKIRYIGTRYSLHDTYATMLKRGAAIPRIFPATHNGRFDGIPVLFSQFEWDKRVRNQGRSTVAAQLLQNPMADESATFQVHWLKSYEVRPRTCNIYIMVDPSMGRNSSSDNTAMAVIAVSASGGKYLVDGLCHRLPLSERWNQLKRLYLKWSRTPGVQHIEVGYERYGMQADVEYFDERMRLERIHFPIQELSWAREGGQSKVERVARLEPDFRNSRFYLPLTVMHEGKPCYWSVGDDPDEKGFNEVHYRPAQGLTRTMMDHFRNGSEDLLAKSLVRIDADGQKYDVTVRLIEEYSTFPFSKQDDLLDAASRVYDLNPRGPTLTSSEMTTPDHHWDD